MSLRASNACRFSQCLPGVAALLARRLRLLRYLSFFLLLLPSLIRAADDSTTARHLDDTLDAKASENYLTDCGTNEIRCLWFRQDNIKVGEIMSFNLRDQAVHTARWIWYSAIQATETHKLTQAQLLSLQKIVEQLPVSDGRVELKRTVSVSTRVGGNLKVFHYDRRHAPAVILRLYDIGGGYFYDGKGE